MISVIEQLHFIRPLWLWAIPVLFLIWLLMRHTLKSSNWDKHISKELLSALQLDSKRGSGAMRWVLMFVWIVLAVAAAGPSWVKTPLPTVENQQAMVMVLDLSPSMLAEDVAPNRLTRAKFKMIDIIRKREDGQIALIAYAGGAHTVSPLTDDPPTIEALIGALNPQMMPSAGSNIESAVELAIALLDDARANSSEILLLTDGVTANAQASIRSMLGGKHRLSILAIGGTTAAPIPGSRGGFLQGANGEIIMAAVNHQELAGLAAALGGRYAELRSDDKDVEYLLSDVFDTAHDQSANREVVYDSWEDMGYWLVLLALPFALYSFRRGLVYALPLLFIIPIESEAAVWDNLSWKDLWKTRDQQAADLMQEKQFGAAAEKFNDRDWSAVANFRNGDYKKAIEQFTSGNEIRDLYNSGNALALVGKIEEAKQAYKKVLEQQADHEDAAFNLALLEQAQDQQQSGENGEQNQDSEQQESQDQSSEGQQNQDQDSQQQESEDSSSEEQKSEGQQSESEDTQDQESETQDQHSDEDSQQEEDEQNQQQQSDEQEPGEEQDESEQAGGQNESEQDEAEQELQAQDSDTPLSDTPEQLSNASEQWLRTIEDDPSGLLKRKFEHQARQRARDGENQPTAEQRY